MMEDLKEYISKHKENKEKADDFVTYLYQLMDKYGFDKSSDLYNKANISRQHWSKIISSKGTPKLELNTVLKLIFALQLDNHECKYLLKKAGYTLSSSDKYALVIRYCIENKIYNLSKVNEYLEENGFGDRLIY